MEKRIQTDEGELNNKMSLYCVLFELTPSACLLLIMIGTLSKQFKKGGELPTGEF